MQVVFKMHQVVPESIIFLSLRLYTLSNTVTQLLQSFFDPNGPSCSCHSCMLWCYCDRFTSNLFYSTSSESSSFLMHSSLGVMFTPDIRHMLVVSEGNNKSVIVYFFIAHSLISLLIIVPTSIGNPLWRTYKRINLS